MVNLKGGGNNDESETHDVRSGARYCDSEIDHKNFIQRKRDDEICVSVRQLQPSKASVVAEVAMCPLLRASRI